ncbi:MAG TPA: ATP-binding cassette domain-containing protein, partial [Bryobacteraceae bacterium]|nr:ATP-binding cassette domain-containing protein [Bryobacteraceae bacterium]
MADAVIRFENVYKSFGAHKVLENVSFEVPRGSALCILGRSGTGKSVTIKQMIGLIKPDSGHIY